MARPAPDPERVVAVWEKTQRWSYRRVVEWSREQWPPDGVSLGTVSEWRRLGDLWWRETEKLDAQAEQDWHRRAIAQMWEDVEDAVEQGDIRPHEAIPLRRLILDRHAKLVGVDAPTKVAARVQAEVVEPQVPPAAVKAIEALRERRLAAEEQRMIEG